MLACSTPQRLHFPGEPEFAQGGEADALVEDLEIFTFDLTQQGAVDFGHHEAGFLRSGIAAWEQGEGFVVNLLRALGLELHELGEALAVAFCAEAELVGFDFELLQLIDGQIDAAALCVFANVADDVCELQGKAEFVGVLGGALIALAEDAGRDFADDACDEVAIFLQAGVIQIARLREVHLAAFDHSLQVALFDIEGFAVRQEGEQGGVAIGFDFWRGKSLADFLRPPGELGGGDAGLAHFIDDIIDLAAKRIKRGDSGAALFGEEEEGVIKAAARLRGFLLNVLLGCHGWIIGEAVGVYSMP